MLNKALNKNDVTRIANIMLNEAPNNNDATHLTNIVFNKPESNDAKHVVNFVHFVMDSPHDWTRLTY